MIQAFRQCGITGREGRSIRGEYCCHHTERMRIKNVLQKLFEGTEYEPLTEEIRTLIEGKEKTSKAIYLNCLHLFGRNSGLAIYKKVKACDEL